jgi:hypothetical protein
LTPAVLYISYDGMLEALGQSQVLGYVERLARDYPMHLISFEKQADRTDKTRMDAMRARLGAAGISWTPLAYHKTPTAPATAFDISVGTAAAIAIATRHRIKIVHARSYVPALMAVAVKRAASGPTNGSTAGCGRATDASTAPPRPLSAAFCWRPTMS